MENETLTKQLDFFQSENLSFKAELDTKGRDIGRLTQKLMDKDDEIVSLKRDQEEKADEIRSKKLKMRDLESSIIERNLAIKRLQDELDEHRSFKILNDQLTRQIKQRDEEAGVLRAKQFLDFVQVSIKLVPEYPDLVEENNEL